MNRKELGKSWHRLAQLSIILAGFLFASAGITYTNSIATLDTSVDVTLKFLDIEFLEALEKRYNQTEISSFKENLNDTTTAMNDAIMAQLELWRDLMIVASIFVFASYVFWVIGHVILRRLE